MTKIIFSLLVFLTFNGAVFATDFYVNPTNGNESNNGLSSSSPFKSLHKIESLSLQPGDVVYFMGGTYTRPGQTLLTINASGTEDNWITFKNYANETPIFEFDSWTGIDVIGGSSYIKFDGLTVKGARSKINEQDALNQPGGCVTGGNPNGLYNGTGILVVGPNLHWSNPATNSVPHHITVNNCEIYDCTSSGVAFQQADYVTVTNNKIYNNCWYTIYGTSGINIYQLVNTDGSTGFHNKISNNLIYGNQLIVPQVPHCAFYDGNGLIVDDLNHTQTGNYKNISNGYDAYSAKTLISNNISVENGGSGLHFYLSSNCYILNNSIINNAFQNDGNNGNADLRIGSCSNFVIQNNVIKGENSVHKNGGNSNIEYSYNYQYGPNIQSTLTNCEGCIENTDITFSNTDINDDFPYITDSSSILVDAGTDVSEVEDDYLYETRPKGNSFDIGAYEANTTDIFPDPNKKYYIDSAHFDLRIGATGYDEEPYTTSTLTTGQEVEWVFVAKGNGYWHIQLALGNTVDLPRLRTDNSQYADMQATPWNGIYTYYELTEGYYEGSYFVTLPDGPTNRKRLQINREGRVRMVSVSHALTWESFNFIEVPTSNAKSTTETQAKTALDSNNTNPSDINIYPNPVKGKDQLYISTEGYDLSKASYQILNTIGQVLEYGNIGSKDYINIQNLSTGIYILHIKNETKTITKQFIVE